MLIKDFFFPWWVNCRFFDDLLANVSIIYHRLSNVFNYKKSKMQLYNTFFVCFLIFIILYIWQWNWFFFIEILTKFWKWSNELFCWFMSFSTLIITDMSLIRNKNFMLDEITYWNALNFAIFLEFGIFWIICILLT